MTTLYPNYPRYIITKITYHNDSSRHLDNCFYIEGVKLSEWVNEQDANDELKRLKTELPRENFSLYVMTDDDIKALSDLKHE